MIVLLFYKRAHTSGDGTISSSLIVAPTCLSVRDSRVTVLAIRLVSRVAEDTALPNL